MLGAFLTPMDPQMPVLPTVPRPGFTHFYFSQAFPDQLERFAYPQDKNNGRARAIMSAVKANTGAPLHLNQTGATF
jgi:hypothetical protein